MTLEQIKYLREQLNKPISEDSNISGMNNPSSCADGFCKSYLSAIVLRNEMCGKIMAYKKPQLIRRKKLGKELRISCYPANSIYFNDGGTCSDKNIITWHCALFLCGEDWEPPA